MQNEYMNSFYEKLYDDESRAIYRARVQYSQDNDYEKLMINLWEILKDKKWDIAPITQRIIQQCDDNEKVIIFGVGNNGKNIYWELKRFSNIEVVCFVDNNDKWRGKSWCGIPVFSLEKLNSCGENYRIIISMGNAEARNQVLEQLREYNISVSDIISPFCDDVKGIYSHVGSQYFDCPGFEWSDEEIFVDAGCCGGEAIDVFKKHRDNKYIRVYGFEPDAICADLCRKKFLADERIVMLQKGAWSVNAQLSFDEKSDGTSCITTSGDKMIEVDSIDNVCINDKVTYIKMDIEGAELEAIKGAKKIIERDKPKLAVCIYHKSEDVWEIPQILMEYNKDYQFAIRHYHLTDYETVLYAW